MFDETNEISEATMDELAFSEQEKNDLIESVVRYEVHLEVQRAYNMGEIELWLEANKSKTLEEWDEFELKHPNFDFDRWKQ